MAVVRLLGISKVASQYIGEVGGEGEILVTLKFSKIRTKVPLSKERSLELL